MGHVAVKINLESAPMVLSLDCTLESSGSFQTLLPKKYPQTSQNRISRKGIQAKVF